MKRVYLVAGEASGDLHGAHLARALKLADPSLEILAAGGPLLRREAPGGFIETTHLHANGLTEVLSRLPGYLGLFAALRTSIRRAAPDLVVLIDNPGFNLRLARRLRPFDIPMVYYICPQIWGWAENRVRIMKRCFKKALVVFDFEEAVYARHSMSARWVGHPLKDLLGAPAAGGPVKEETIGAGILLMPGSRHHEVETLLPILLETARRIRRTLPDARFLLVKADTLAEEFYRPILARSPIEVEMVRDRKYDTMRSARLALVCSGTATLECAILGVPMIIVNRASFLTCLAACLVAKVRWLGLPNLIAGRRIVPELLQYACTPERIAREAEALLGDGGRIREMKRELAEVNTRVGGPGASERAAEEIRAILRDG